MMFVASLVFLLVLPAILDSLDSTHSVNVDETSWHQYRMGEWTCLDRNDCPSPRDDDPMDNTNMTEVQN